MEPNHVIVHERRQDVTQSEIRDHRCPLALLLEVIQSPLLTNRYLTRNPFRKAKTIEVL